MRVIAGSARGVGLKAPPGAETRPTSDKIRGVIFDVLASVVNGARVLDLYAGTGALGVEALSRGAEGCLFVEHGAQAARVVGENLRAARVAEHGTIWRLDVSKALDRLEALAAASGSSTNEEGGDPKGASHDDEGDEGAVAEEGDASIGAATDATTEMDRQSRLAPASSTWQGIDTLARTAARPGASGIAGRAAREPDAGLALPAPGRAAKDGRAGERGRRPMSLSLPEGSAPPYTIVILDPPYADASIVAVVERIGAAYLLAPGALVVLEHSKRVSPPAEVGMLRLRRARRYGDTAVTIWEYPREG